MELTIQRRPVIGEALPGELLNPDGSHFLYTLERVAVAIPEGRFKVGWHDSPHFGRIMPLLLGIPGRDDILFHWGNYPENSDGCVLVGESEDGKTGDIYNTRAAFDTLMRVIQPLVDSAEGVWVTVAGAQTPASSQS